VSRSAAIKIIAYNAPIIVQSDVVLMDRIVAGKLKAFALNKPISHQSSNLMSYIGTRALRD
jgi:hypothetical protein